MSHTAFFYGTLMAPPILRRVIWGSQTPPTPAHASLLRIRPAVLHGHERHKVRHADYPAVVSASAQSSVRGTLVEGLTDGDIWRLDIFEGSEYQRRKVKARILQQNDAASDDNQGFLHVTQDQGENLELEEVEEVEAETYVWIAGMDKLDMEQWDFAEFVRDKMKRWVGKDAAETDSGFQDVDNAVAASQDPTGGRGMNGSIGKQLAKDGNAQESMLKSAV